MLPRSIQRYWAIQQAFLVASSSAYITPVTSPQLDKARGMVRSWKGALVDKGMGNRTGCWWPWRLGGMRSRQTVEAPSMRSVRIVSTF